MLHIIILILPNGKIIEYNNVLYYGNNLTQISTPQESNKVYIEISSKNIEINKQNIDVSNDVLISFIDESDLSNTLLFSTYADYTNLNLNVSSWGNLTYSTGIALYIYYNNTSVNNATCSVDGISHSVGEITSGTTTACYIKTISSLNKMMNVWNTNSNSAIDITSNINLYGEILSSNITNFKINLSGYITMVTYKLRYIT